MTTRKLQYKAVQGAASSHVGSPGDLFYDPAESTLRIYNGSPGGLSIGGGGASALLVPEDSQNQTYILDAPSAEGQIYTVVIPYSFSSGNVTFQVAAISGADLVVFVGGITGFKNYTSGTNGEVTEVNSWTISRSNASAFKIDFVYQGLLNVEGNNYAIFVVHGMGFLNAG